MGVFAQITRGPVSPTGKGGSPEALYLDSDSNVVESTGTLPILQALRSVLNPTAGVAASGNFTTATPIAKNVFNKNFLNKVLRKIEFSGTGTYISPGTTTPTLTFALNIGGTNVCTITTAALSSTASSGMPFSFRFSLLVSSNATATTARVQCEGAVKINISANTPAAAVAEYLNAFSQVVLTGINLAQAVTAEVTVLGSSAITAVTCDIAQVEVLN